MPAPTEAISSANLADYNKVLNGQAPYGDNNTFDFGVTFDGEKYSLLGQSEIDQASAENTPMFNFFNDRAYTYMKIGNDMYFQRTNAKKDKMKPDQYTKVDPVKFEQAYKAIAALKFTKTGQKE